jgi:hypothetical protein
LIPGTSDPSQSQTFREKKKNKKKENPPPTSPPLDYDVMIVVPIEVHLKIFK